MTQDKELSMDMLNNVSGGTYTVDESIPEVQEMIRIAIELRKYHISAGFDLNNPSRTTDFDRAIFNAYGEYIKKYGWTDGADIQIFYRYYLNDTPFPG